MHSNLHAHARRVARSERVEGGHDFRAFDARSSDDRHPSPCVMPSPRGVDPRSPRAGCYACYFLLTLGVASAMTPTALTLAKDLSWDVAPGSSATYYGLLRRVRDGEAVLRVGERPRTRSSSSRRARVRRVLRERGERVGDDARSGRRRGGPDVVREVWEVSARAARVRVSGWTRRGTERGVFDVSEGGARGRWVDRRGRWGREPGAVPGGVRGGDRRREREASGGFERGVDVRGGGRSVDVRLGE